MRVHFTRWLLAFALPLGVLAPERASAQNTLLQQDFTGQIVPQYLSGSTGSTNNNRMPVIFRATLSGLTPGTTYRYIVQAGISSDLSGTNSGAGNPLFLRENDTYFTSSSPNLAVAGTLGTTYDTLVANSNGQRTRYFGFVPTGNSRFNAGNSIIPTITYHDNASPPTGTGATVLTVRRRALNLGITSIVLGTTATATAGSYLRGASSATAKHVVFVYDNTAGTGRPLSGSVVESIGTALGTGLVTGYATTAGAYNTVIPNVNANGVRYIEVRNQLTNVVSGCAQDADGVWTSGANTVSPITGTTAIAITSADAPLSTCGGGPNPTPVLTSISPTTAVAGSGAFTLTLNGSGFYSGSVVKWNNSNRVTTFVNAGQLTAAITAADVASASTANVTVFNAAPGGGTSSGQTFTVTASITPTITITGSAPSPFSTADGTPSAVQSYQVAASSLTTDVTIVAPTGFEVSESSGSGFASSIVLAESDVESGPTDVYVRFNPAAAGSAGGSITHNASGATQQTVPVTGFAISAQPTTKSTVSFGATTQTSLVVNFSGGNGQKRLVLAREGFATNFTPVDGTLYTANASFGAGTGLGTGLDNYVVYSSTGNTVTVTGLTGGTQYFFSVYEFNDDNLVNTANYLTTAPVASNNTTTSPAPAVTYTWDVASGNWTTPTSWSPARTTALASDILVFDGTQTPAVVATMDFTPIGKSNTPAANGVKVGQLKFINGVNARFTTADDRVINIDGAQAGTDFLIDAASRLTIENTVTQKGLYIYITPGETGSVLGQVVLDGTVATASGATSKLLASNTGSGLPADGALVFGNGAVLLQGRNFSGNVFSDQAIHLNSVVFQNGATLRQQGGSNAFGQSQPNSSVQFQAGSTYSYEQWNASPAGSGRTYANLTIDIATPPGGSTAAPTLTGGSAFKVLGDLRILNATSAAFGTSPMEVTGNIEVNVPTTISSASLTFSGTGTQTLTGTANLTLSAAAVTVNSTVEAMTGNVTLGNTSQTFGGTGSLTFFDLTTGGASISTTLNLPVAVKRLLTLNNGSIASGANRLTLASDVTNTAMVVNAGLGQVTGTATVERFINPINNAGLGYRHLSSPVQATTFADLQTAGFTPFLNPAYNTIPAPALTQSQFPNIFGYDETRGGATTSNFVTGYFSPLALTDAMVSGRGYSVYVPATAKPDFTGTLTNGNVTMTGLTRTGNFTGAQKSGWHLLGNPYPSPIDWDLVTIPAGMSSAVSVWRSTGDGNQGAYTTYTNGVGPANSDRIAMGQGFFARVTSTTGPVSFTFNNAARVTTYVNPSVSRPASSSTPSQVETRPLLALALRGASAAASAADEAFVYFQNGATTAIDDRFDAEKPGFNDGIPTLVTLTAAAEGLAINGLDLSALTYSQVPMLLKLPTAGTYVLEPTRFLNFNGTAVRLLDHVTNTAHDLSTNQPYTFTATTAGELRGRFTLEFGQRVTGVSADAAVLATIGVWPNPTAGQLHITLPANLTVSRAALTDALGRTVALPTLHAGATTDVSLAGQPAGVYVLHLTTSAGVVTRRIVLE